MTCSFIKLTELIKVVKKYRSWREILIDFKYHIAFCLIIGPLASQFCRIFPQLAYENLRPFSDFPPNSLIVVTIYNQKDTWIPRKNATVSLHVKTTLSTSESIRKSWFVLSTVNFAKILLGFFLLFFFLANRICWDINCCTSIYTCNFNYKKT